MNQSRAMAQLTNVRAAPRCGAKTRAGGACHCSAIAIATATDAGCTVAEAPARRRGAPTATSRPESAATDDNDHNL